MSCCAAEARARDQGTTLLHRAGPVVAVLVIVGFALARFVSLDADPPAGLTWSASLYTDEGLWSRNAVWKASTGSGYIEGGYNPAVSLPALYPLQVLTFRWFGVGLTQARAVVAISAVLLIAALCFGLTHTMGPRVALLAGLVISTNYLFFAHSRLGFLDVPMAFAATLSVLCVMGREPSVWRGVLSGGFLLLAILIKSTAAALVAVIGVLVWLQWGATLPALLRAAATAAVPTLGALSYWLWSVNVFPGDWTFFQSQNLNTQGYENPLGAFRRLWDAAADGAALGAVLYALAAAVLVAALLRARERRIQPLVAGAGLWLVLFVTAFAVRDYSPPRYFAPLVVPVAILVAIGVDDVLKEGLRTHAARIVLILFALGVGLNAAATLRTLIHPQYSYANFVAELEERFQAEGVADPVLAGDNAVDTVALATGTRAIALAMGAGDASLRVARHELSHLVTLGPPADSISGAVATRYRIDPPVHYDVLGNYSNGRSLWVSRLHRKPD